ncbi:CpsD/CapB family tyrosine-protein kinase [Geomonas sp.]|uniref:CpsD/CapB family tyrosine-protein kinase n=1 Tax=Geomonas sp. TaxID=2651584 RepID=UPI002B4A3C80|nr:CpsD/CapB family tyrosine-protein kinase [Geomonas sp.]HJV36948.1 CpsD/CapB family tyrosine-protein kinase [Geomonas sp.]
MSNIYEALIQAEQEKKGEPAVITLPEEEERPIAPPLTVRRASSKTGFSADTELFDLYRHISGLMADSPGRTIQFISTRPGEGVSSVVREFARAAALRFNKRVLIMDAAHHHPTQHLNFKIPEGFGWRDALSAGTPILKACFQGGDKNLFVSPISMTPALTPRIHDEAAGAAMFSELRESFDLIVIDSSPATVSADSVALTRFVDGVVLVLEAEKTRWQVAENVKNRILKNGGNILGVIFNKRRFYIPDSVYRHL